MDVPAPPPTPERRAALPHTPLRPMGPVTAALRRCGALCTHPRLPVAAAALALLLTLPALRIGFHSDDLAHRLALRGEPLFFAQRGDAMNLFTFADGDPARNREAISAGLFPWWTSEGLRLAFWRPLAALTHLIDARLWPDSAPAAHAVSLAWFVPVVVAAAWLYRRLMGPTWVAGLAGLMFAVDDAHAGAAAWIASRNVLVSTLFALLAIAMHAEWRRTGSRAAAVGAPLFLLLALLGGEGGIGALGYLLAHALFLDRSAPRDRLFALVPALVVVLGWGSAYAALGYGTIGSGIYTNPLGEPARFAADCLERAPVQVLALCAFPPGDAYVWLSPDAARFVWWTGVGVLLLAACLAAPALRRDPVARFWALGGALALLPACATLPADRVLMLAGLGTTGLIASTVATMLDATRSAKRTVARSAALVAAAAVGLVHLPLAALALPARVLAYAADPAIAAGLLTLLPEGEAAADRHLVMINAPSALWGTFLRAEFAAAGRQAPARLTLLATGPDPVELERDSPRTLVVRPQGGYLRPASEPPNTGAPRPAAHVAHMLRRADFVFRREGRPPPAHRPIALAGVTITVTGLTPDGRPREVRFEFEQPLEDARYLWRCWTDGGYKAFAPPPVGGRITLSADPPNAD